MAEIMTPLKTIRSHSGHARFLAECDTDSKGDLVVVREIRSSDVPESRYAFGPTRFVYRHLGREIVVVETAHRCFQVFDATGIPTALDELPVAIVGRHYRGFEGELITVLGDQGGIVTLSGDRSPQTWTIQDRGAVLSELERNEIKVPAWNKFGVLYDSAK